MLLALCGNFVLIVLAMPPPPWLLADDTLTGDALMRTPGARVWGKLAIATSGLFAGALVPPATELLAEDQLLNEGTSANLVMLLHVAPPFHSSPSFPHLSTQARPPTSSCCSSKPLRS